MAIITVGMVTYNCINDVLECLETIRTQKRPPDEIIIVDNGSTDATWEAVSHYLRRYFPNSSKLIKNTSNNIGSARDLLMRNATGAWVAMTDPDCRVPAHWLEKFERYVEENPNLRILGGGNRVVVRSNFLRVLEMMSGFFLGHMNSTQLRHDFPTGPVDQIPTCNIFYHRESVLDVGSFSARYVRVCEDVELNYRLKRRGLQPLFINDNAVLHDHRRSAWSWICRLFQFGSGHWTVIGRSPHYFSWRQGLPLFYGVYFVMALMLGGWVLGFLALGLLMQLLLCCRIAFRQGQWKLSLFLFVSVSFGQLFYALGNLRGCAHFILAKIVPTRKELF